MLFGIRTAGTSLVEQILFFIADYGETNLTGEEKKKDKLNKRRRKERQTHMGRE